MTVHPFKCILSGKPNCGKAVIHNLFLRIHNLVQNADYHSTIHIKRR